MIFDITDPKCDVEKLFIDFLKYYDEEIIHDVSSSTWSVDKYNVYSWLESRLKPTLEETSLALAMSDRYTNELISAWNQSGFIKPRKPKYWYENVWDYAFTMKGLKLKRRKRYGSKS